MSYGAGYKRARPDDFVDYGPIDYGPPGGFGGPQVGMETMLPPVGIGLGEGPDGSFPVVKLRGLPFDCGEPEIKVFLEVDTVDIVLVKRAGRLSGEAFVVLPGMIQVEFALSKHKAYLGKRYVEVAQAAKEDYYRAVAALVAEADREGGMVAPMRRAFKPLQPRMDRQSFGGPSMQMNGGGHPIMPRGPAREMLIPDIPPRGPRDMSRPHPPPRPMGRERPPMDRLPHMQGPAATGPAAATGILKLRGLPFSASREDVAMWFNESRALAHPIDVESVHLVLAYDGRPTGSAFVEFIDAADAHNAMVRDKAMMGNRYVELFHSSREEVLHTTGGGY